MTAALLAFAGLFALLFAGLPIVFGLGLVGFLGAATVLGWGPASAMVGQVTFDTVRNYSFSVLPLFILMGNFIVRARLADELYAASYAFLGHRRGGLAMATILACGGFSAVCGSSMATASTMAKVAVPSMRAYGYSASLAASVCAAGGTLGILIPPSVALLFYGIMTDNDIGKLFIAGVVPGLIGILGYMAAIAWVTARRPELGPPGQRTAWPQRFAALRSVWAIVGLLLMVLGGIYFGVFTVTEAAGIGAAGGFLIALVRGRLTLTEMAAVLAESVRTTSVMLAMLVGALLFNNFLDLTRVPAVLGGWLAGLQVPGLVVMLAILGIYLLLGCVLESLSMMLLTVPLFYPIVVGLGYDPIWFGVIVVVAIEIGLITPPIGMNVLVINSLLPDVPANAVFRGLGPFIAVDVVRLLLLLLAPPVVLFLPRLMS